MARLAANPEASIVPVQPPAQLPPAALQPPPPPPPSGPPQSTSLQITLVATMVQHNPTYSSAVIIDQSAHSAAYFIGDGIPGGGRVIAIAPRWVDFERNHGGPVERLEITLQHDAPRAVVGMAVPPPPAMRAAQSDPLAADMDTSLKQTGANTYEISRSFVDRMLADPMMIMKSARMRPGKDGITVFGVKAGGAADRLGLKNADRILAINGAEMSGTSADEMLALYNKLKSAPQLSLRVQRGDKQVDLQYTIR